LYYYDALVACPDKLSFGMSEAYYYYGEYYEYPYGEEAYYGTFLTQGQAHDGMITYTNTELNRASGMVVGGRNTIHMKFECDENPGVSVANEDAFGAQGYTETYYYSRDGSVVYKVKGACAC